MFIAETNGTAGTPQNNASIAMTPDGSFVEVWTQETTDSPGDPTNQNIYYRTYQESTDTAGPEVAEWLTPDQTQIDPSEAVYSSDGLQHIVISFDVPMLDNATHTGDAVTNPANYALLSNGVQINGAIVKVQYGLNEAANLAAMAAADPTDYGQYADLSSLPTNH